MKYPNLTRRIVDTSKRKPTRTRGKTFEWFYNEKNNMWLKVKKAKRK